MQRGQRLVDFAARYGLRLVPSACSGVIDFDGFENCAGSDPVNSSLHGGATDAAVNPYIFIFLFFYLAFVLMFGRFFFG